ncbi:MAG: hypothetical protein NC078_03980 [Ruminococcus sp.]|nr:hypothetical protein [Ruminococcus sp.]
MDFSSALKLARYDLRFLFPPYIAAAVLTAFLTYVIFGIADLNFTAAAQPLEMFLSLSGAVLMTSVFRPEQREGVREVIRSKKTSFRMLCLMRICCAVIITAAVTAVFILAMKACGSSVHAVHFLSGFGAAFFLGAAGLALSGFSDNTTAGYMGALVLYMANFGLKENLGDLYLFRISFGEMTASPAPYFWGIALIILTLLFGKPFR